MSLNVAPKRSVVAVRHVHFETLGIFEQELVDAGYAVSYCDVGEGGLENGRLLDADLVVILGGPIGVYETETYPFLVQELKLIKARLDAGLPLVGLCLGAQLIASALGADVGPTGTREIGFPPIDLTDAGRSSPLRHLSDVPVLHWHGDAFDLPVGADLLATTTISNQAFALGHKVLAIQFHPEADTTHGLEKWLIGHAAELAGAGIDPRTIRSDARRYGPALHQAGRAVFAEWLARLEQDID